MLQAKGPCVGRMWAKDRRVCGVRLPGSRLEQGTGMRWRAGSPRGGRCGSGEVHGPQGVVVDLNRLGQRLGVPAVALTGHMAALSTEGRRQRGKGRHFMCDHQEFNILV